MQILSLTTKSDLTFALLYFLFYLDFCKLMIKYVFLTAIIYKNLALIYSWNEFQNFGVSFKWSFITLHSSKKPNLFELNWI